jgi:hypothetical protein
MTVESTRLRCMYTEEEEIHPTEGGVVGKERLSIMTCWADGWGGNTLIEKAEEEARGVVRRIRHAPRQDCNARGQ